MTRQFYMLPKELFESEDYQEMSLHAKVLYSLMRDRRSLSETNRWKDNGRTFIVFAQDNMCDLLGCKKDKVIKTLRELEEAELIERKIIGRKQPNYYYVEDILPQYSFLSSAESVSSKNKNEKTEFTEVGKTECNYTDFSNNTDFIYTDYNQSIFDYDPNDVEKQIKENIEYDILVRAYKEDVLKIDEYISIMVEEICNQKKTVLIGENVLPRSILRKRFFDFNSLTIEYVLESMKKSTAEIGNVRSYLLASLFNATATMDNYYTLEVNHDLHGTA